MDNLMMFYNSILNLRNQGRMKQIEEIVLKRRIELKELVGDVEGFCKYIASVIYEELKDNNITVYIIDLKGIVNVDHVVLIAEYREGDMMRRVLIDPTFEQFNKKEGRGLRNLEEWPSEKIKDKEFVRELLDKGCIEVDNLSFSNYLSAFNNFNIQCDLDVFLLGLRINKDEEVGLRKRFR